jgi:hypothetical protein
LRGGGFIPLDATEAMRADAMRVSRNVGKEKGRGAAAFLCRGWSSRCPRPRDEVGGANAQGGHLVSTDPKPFCLHSVSIVFRQKGKWFRRETRLWSVVWAQQS